MESYFRHVPSFCQTCLLSADGFLDRDKWFFRKACFPDRSFLWLRQGEPLTMAPWDWKHLQVQTRMMPFWYSLVVYHSLLKLPCFIQIQLYHYISMVYFNNSLAQRGRQWAHALEILNKMKAKDVQATLKMAESCVEFFQVWLKKSPYPPPKQPDFPNHPGFPNQTSQPGRFASLRWTLQPPVASFLPVHRPRNWPRRRMSSWCLGRNRAGLFPVDLPSL